MTTWCSKSCRSRVLVGTFAPQVCFESPAWLANDRHMRYMSVSWSKILALCWCYSRNIVVKFRVLFAGAYARVAVQDAASSHLQQMAWRVFQYGSMHWARCVLVHTLVRKGAARVDFSVPMHLLESSHAETSTMKPGRLSLECAGLRATPFVPVGTKLQDAIS